MAGIPGTNVVAPVVPLDTADVHPTHEALYGKGGYRTVATTVERDAIPAARREAGMLVFVAADSQRYRLGTDLTTWTVDAAGTTTWAGITDKPSTFAPSTHTHNGTEVFVFAGNSNIYDDGDSATTCFQSIETAFNQTAVSLGQKAAASHAHGNITNAGAIGSTSGQIVVTTTGGVLTTAATIASGSVSGLATVATSGSASDLGSGTLPVARLSLVSPPAIGGTTPAAGTFTTLVSTGRLNAPSGAGGSPAARDIYAVSDTLRYRDSGNVERLILNATDNLANLTNAATARTNLGLAAVASSGSAGDLSAGTLARTRYAADLGTGSMTVSGSNSYGVSLDATARTLSQANAFSIMGGPVGIGTLAPLSTGALEVSSATNNAGTREVLRVRSTHGTTTGFFGIGIGTSGYYQNQTIFSVNGTAAMRFSDSPAGLPVFSNNVGVDNNSQLYAISNANAYLNMHDGSGGMQLSFVSFLAFQRSYVEVGRWDTNSVLNVGTSHASASGCAGSSVTGTQARVRVANQISTSAGQFAAAGDAQASRYHLRNSTTNATATTLFRDGSSARIVIPAQSAWAFKIRLSAYNSTDNTGAAWTINGGIRRDNANGTALLGSPTVTQYADASMSGASVAVTADDTNEAIQVNVTGLASKTIRWHAVVETSEVSAGTPT